MKGVLKGCHLTRSDAESKTQFQNPSTPVIVCVHKFVANLHFPFEIFFFGDIFRQIETLRQPPWQASACTASPTCAIALEFDQFVSFLWQKYNLLKMKIVRFAAIVTVPSLACQQSAVCHCLLPEVIVTSRFA